MTQICEAIFENGVFRPKALPRDIAEGEHLRLIVETGDPPASILELAAQVYADMSEAEVEEVERIALDRRDFFQNRSAR